MGSKGRPAPQEPGEFADLPQPEGARAASWREMGRDALLAGDPAEALWCLRHAVEIDSDDPATWSLMGRCFEEIGADARARKCYRLASRQSAARAREAGTVRVAPRARRAGSRGPLDA